MISFQQPSADAPDTDVPLKPHRYPAWLIGSVALIICAVIYSAILIPPYLGAFKALRHGEAAAAAGARAEAEASLGDALRLVPSSKAARIEIAVLLFADPSPARQDRALEYLEGVELDRYQWSRISAVLPERFRTVFTTIRG
jgi:hypothetical protein